MTTSPPSSESSAESSILLVPKPHNTSVPTPTVASAGQPPAYALPVPKITLEVASDDLDKVLRDMLATYKTIRMEHLLAKKHHTPYSHDLRKTVTLLEDGRVELTRARSGRPTELMEVVSKVLLEAMEMMEKWTGRALDALDLEEGNEDVQGEGAEDKVGGAVGGEAQENTAPTSSLPVDIRLDEILSIILTAYHDGYDMLLVLGGHIGQSAYTEMLGVSITMLEDARVEVARADEDEKRWELFEKRLAEVRELRMKVMAKEMKEMDVKVEVDGGLSARAGVAEEGLEVKEKEESGETAVKGVNENA